MVNSRQNNAKNAKRRMAGVPKPMPVTPSQMANLSDQGNTLNMGTIIDLKVSPSSFHFTHVDANAASITDPLDAATSSFNMAKNLWGARQNASLYQFFRVNWISYQYVPVVSYTWTGTVASRVVNDPMDQAATNSGLTSYINAPSSFISPVYAPSSVMTWRPSQAKKYCFASITTDAPDQANQPAHVSLQKHLTSRMESYGKLQHQGFDVKDASGATPSGDTVIGRLVIKMNVTYSSPVPLVATDMDNKTIYTLKGIPPTP
jgi:hypothetical protein